MQRHTLGPAAVLLLALATAAAARAGSPATLGFIGNSGNDTAQAFDRGTGLPVGSEIDLLPEGDYPYDATIKPDGSELWIPGAVGDGVIVLDPATQAQPGECALFEDGSESGDTGAWDGAVE